VIIQDSLLTIRQMPERPMRAPLLKGLLATFIAMVLIGFSVGFWLSSLFSGWTIPFTGIAIGGAGGWLAGAGAFSAMLFAFVPAAALAVSFFIDPVADAVEGKHYPDALPQTPPLPALVNGYLLGREYFSMAALRQMPAVEVKKLRRRATLSIWTAGALLAFMVTIPVLNLLAPVFGAGLMTHVFNRARRRSNA